MGNPIVYWEMMSRAPKSLSAFYEQVFGWKARPAQHMQDYMALWQQEGKT